MDQLETTNRQKKITLILFGATGNLARSKLLPGIARLNAEQSEYLVHCIAVGRKEMTTDEYVKTYVSSDNKHPFGDTISYLQADISSVDELDVLSDYLETHHKNRSGIIFYFATPTRFYHPVSQKLKELGLTKEQDYFSRADYEKLFGNSLDDAKELLSKIQETFSVPQIYFVDHYLGKEIVQDILSAKLFNPLYGASFDNRYIKSIEITLSEHESIGTRGQYYDSVGVIRDMVQNHMVQLSALTTLDTSDITSHTQLVHAKQDALESLQFDTQYTPVIGQYKGYHTEEHISPDSQTPTFVSVTLRAHKGPLKGVPIHLRTGKALDSRYGFIRIRYKKKKSVLTQNVQSNVLTFHIQPDVKLEACINVGKHQIAPDVQQETTPLCNLLSRTEDPREAYERLLFEVICGRKMLFANAEEILSGWRIIHSLEHYLRERSVKLQIYEQGSSVTSLIGNDLNEE